MAPKFKEFNDFSDLSGFVSDDSEYDGNTVPIGMDNDWIDNDYDGKTKLISGDFTPEPSEGGRTEIFLPPSVKIDPAVGWLVCVDGVDKGRSFRLVKGNNPIGRPGGAKKYAVPLSDQAISRKGACGVIVYNEKSNRFFITPGDLTTNINPYLDDEILLSPKQLQARSRIEIAGEQLIFVPFCSDKFKWCFGEAEASQGKQPNTGAANDHRIDDETNDVLDNDPDGPTRAF